MFKSNVPSILGVGRWRRIVTVQIGGVLPYYLLELAKSRCNGVSCRASGIMLGNKEASGEKFETFANPRLVTLVELTELDFGFYGGYCCLAKIGDVLSEESLLTWSNTYLENDLTLRLNHISTAAHFIFDYGWTKKTSGIKIPSKQKRFPDQHVLMWQIESSDAVTKTTAYLDADWVDMKSSIPQGYSFFLEVGKREE